MPNKKINELTPRTPTLTDLIIVGDPSSGFSFKATLSAMVNFVGGNIQFSSLGGISLTNPTNGQVLTYNGTAWVNQTPAAVPVSSVFGRTGAVVAAEGDYSLTQLSDVTLTSPTSNQVLQYNGSSWMNGTISVPVTSVFGRTGNVVATEGDYNLNQLGDVTISTPTSGQVLKYNGSAWVNDSDTDTGITSLNGLTATTQTFATGTSGTDFAISSTTSTHTFNLPTASATNRGALSSTDWSTFNAKQNAITLTTTGSSGAATFVSNTLNVPNYTLAGLGGVSGSGTTNYVPKWTGTSALGNSQIFDNGTSVGIGTATPSATYILDINGITRGTTFVSSGKAFRFNDNGTQGQFASDGSNTFIDFVGALSFRNNGSTTSMRLSSNGRLLIGTTTESTYELDVVGDIRSTLDANINGLTVGRGGGNLDGNTVVGSAALTATNTGGGNTVYGYQAFQAGTTANSNTAIGVHALQNLTTTNNNTAVGRAALRSALTANDCVAVGFQAGQNLTSGSSNTFVGAGTGGGITTGQFNTIIGAYVTGLSSSLSNTIILADGQGNQRLYINNSGNVGIGTTSPNASALLNVSSTTRGFLPPRMTNAQMVAIATPAAGLMVYDTTNNKLNYYNGTAWTAL